MDPLCNGNAKAMLRLWNKPLIWYCLQPWVEHGVKEFFLCLKDPCPPLAHFVQKEWPHLTFHIVDVSAAIQSTDAALGPNSQGRKDQESEGEEEEEEEAGSVKALAAYAQFKRRAIPQKDDSVEKRTCFGEGRDVLLLSCDSIVTMTDVQPFILSFYSTFSSLSVMLWRPLPQEKASPPGSEKAAKVDRMTEPQPFEQKWMCVAYEDSDASDPAPPVEHHRLHLIFPLGKTPDPILPTSGYPIGFLARRPHLCCCADVVSPHIYLIRNWVVDYVESKADRFNSVEKDLVLYLAKSQHTLINDEQNVVRTPAQKIDFQPPNEGLLSDYDGLPVAPHWALDTTGMGIGALNAARGSVPRPSDTLRIFCSIYNQQPLGSPYPQRILRVWNKRNLLALSHEVAAAVETFNGLSSGPIRPIAAMALSGDDQMVFHSPNVTRSTTRSALSNHSVYLVNSSVGQNVSFGSNVRITNSIVLDNVEIGNNVIIWNSIIAVGASIAHDVKVRRSFVGPSIVVEKSIENDGSV
jgi:NDP-sugar pyrophosphorylase family protein